MTTATRDPHTLVARYCCECGQSYKIEEGMIGGCCWELCYKCVVREHLEFMATQHRKFGTTCPCPDCLGYRWYRPLSGPTTTQKASQGPYRLQNDQSRQKPKAFAGQEPSAQKALLGGLDCLPGQLDLFSTDGSH